MDKKYKILIADDEPEFVLLMRHFLEECGYETCNASEGVRTIETAIKMAPDLILLDILMPAGNGLYVLDALRNNPQTEKIPVIVITASPETQLEAKIRTRGAQDFLGKPFDHEVLMEKIKALLTPRRPLE